ncbi:1-phosphatidylinositol-3-phosphate 5-kinase FAB1B [Apostasia shenzhenica]|uniref:1-phosphatidylinositol-3-phosphate 5-kinase FAB1B n=1 Tax=Apostasia shenzhenica TaxID=1088818 RepID=A0A2I0AZ00_9ASPA|nr:1-phosphatidylinositol-3-phosphate 5-kinase FAB1B [Apostasia shenzhenica]
MRATAHVSRRVEEEEADNLSCSHLACGAEHAKVPRTQATRGQGVGEEAEKRSGIYHQRDQRDLVGLLSKFASLQLIEMQPASDLGARYYAHQFPPSHPNSNTSEFAHANPIQPAYASPPPYSRYPTSEFPESSSSSSFAVATPYPSYSQNRDAVSSIPPSALSYLRPQSQSEAPSSQFPSISPAPYDPSAFQPEQSPVQVSAPYAHHQQPASAPYFPYYESHQNYASQPSCNPNPGHSPSSITPLSFAYSSYENHYEGGVPRFDHSGGYRVENSGKFDMITAGSYGQSCSGNDHEYYEKGMDREFQFEQVGAQDDGFGRDVYAYDGGKAEPYSARGTIPRSSSSFSCGGFDDYGRSTSFSSAENDHGGSTGKIFRAVPSVDAQQDVKNGVQKFRVKLLPEGSNVHTEDVLCQIGLDGVRMLDPSTNRTLRIYPLESVTRWEVLDSIVFCFWSKTSVDVEPKRIRLKSNSYTISTILDTVTAASVQFKEMGANDVGQARETTDANKPSEQPSGRKKGFAEWMNMMKPGNEEREHWVPDETVSQCTSCGVAFGPFVRKHHCRNCGDIFCDKCSQGRTALSTQENAQPVRVCDGCMAETAQRLSNAMETSSRSAVLYSHEDLARKLQEEMERNRKSSSGSKSSDSIGRRMREVACPICTVHLQVQVPTSGSETIECGVCQHPFLVSAH